MSGWSWVDGGRQVDGYLGGGRLVDSSKVDVGEWR